MFGILRIKFNFSALQFQCVMVKRWKRWLFLNRLKNSCVFERHKSIDRWIKWHLLWSIRFRFLNFHMIEATSIYTAQNNAQWVMTHSFEAAPTAAFFRGGALHCVCLVCYNIVAVIQHVAWFWHLTNRCTVTVMVSHSTEKNNNENNTNSDRKVHNRNNGQTVDWTKSLAQTQKHNERERVRERVEKHITRAKYNAICDIKPIGCHCLRPFLSEHKHVSVNSKCMSTECRTRHIVVRTIF